jgi:hypothetical protein
MDTDLLFTPDGIPDESHPPPNFDEPSQIETSDTDAIRKTDALLGFRELLFLLQSIKSQIEDYVHDDAFGDKRLKTFKQQLIGTLADNAGFISSYDRHKHFKRLIRKIDSAQKLLDFLADHIGNFDARFDYEISKTLAKFAYLNIRFH